MILLDSPLATGLSCEYLLYYNATLAALYSIQNLLPNPYLRKLGIGVFTQVYSVTVNARWFQVELLTPLLISNQKYLLPMQAAWMPHQCRAISVAFSHSGPEQFTSLGLPVLFASSHWHCPRARHG